MTVSASSVIKNVPPNRLIKDPLLVRVYNNERVIYIPEIISRFAYECLTFYETMLFEK